jgi:uncharacterized damage-inducible protein DinB
VSVSEREDILDELHRAWDGDPWHGDSLLRILDGVTAEQAAARPLAHAHSIGELVLHLGSWSREVARRLRDRVARDPEAGDWPPFGGGEPAWRAVMDAMDQAHRELLAAIGSFPAADLPATVGDDRDRPLGAGVAFAVMLHGTAQHYAYHAGQIALLRKALG